MANKRITDVDIVDSLNSNESFFINQNNSLKQINKNNVVFGVTNGGTGATTAAQALTNLGAVSKSGDTMTGDLLMGRNCVKDVECIEITPTQGSSHGGYIDFHFGGDAQKDYTTRIIEHQSGQISISKNGGEPVGIIPGLWQSVVELTVDGWKNSNQVKDVSLVAENNIVVVAPNPSHSGYFEYINSKIRCTKQETNKLTFTCDSIPAQNIEVNIFILTI